MAPPTRSGCASAGTRVVLRVRRRATTRTTAPGSVATSASTPYTTATVTPSAAPSPTELNAHAAAPSRGPQPAMFVGTAEAVSTTSATGNSRAGDTSAPGARTAI